MSERFDTPEQRAALERRLGEAVGKIADEPLRRHYQADMKRRLSAFFGDERDRPARGYAARGAVSPSGAAVRFRHAVRGSGSRKRRSRRRASSAGALACRRARS